MVSEIRIYIEGGGQGDTRARLRQGFSVFLAPLREHARHRNIRWYIVVCGGREQTLDDFMTALKVHSHALNVLLVDSEGLVNSGPWQYLQQRDNWACPQGVSDDQCHLMVQTMETWLIADQEALRNYYGPSYIVKQIFRNAQIERIDRHELARALEEATRRTQKGAYHKIRHAADLLARLDVAKVRRAAPHCERLFTSLTSKMDED
jgi:hypothetical protein